jgi:hypothetical protein
MLLMVTTRQVQDRLEPNEMTVYRHAAPSRIPPTRIAKAWRFDKNAIVIVQERIRAKPVGLN